MTVVRIGDREVGDGHPCYVIAEIGINHNGDVAQAKRLITVASGAGCDAVKFQKRTIDVVYRPEELAKPRESMPWFASCWDEASVDFIDQFDPPCYKIASASLTDDNLLCHTRATGNRSSSRLE